MSNNRQSQTVETTKPIYGVVEFSKPAVLRKSEKYGRVSSPCIQCKVPVNGTGLAVECAIWGERKETKDGIEVEFGASLPRGFVPYGDGADDAREAFIAHVEASAQLWNGFDSATDAAVALLTGITAKGAKPARTRLVKRPAAERPAATA